ncbi:MAG: SDR family oxidoreductase [Acidimicrobiia bacterium]|nr:SDR family oxidoreductase [Acidimicrobiia bacterium]MCY4434840.1 SDR family NAD(P)-dependent oxidoreductase [bacterium]
MEALSERRVLVVGASSGLGRATAIALQRLGAHVAFAARRRDVLEAAVEEAEGGHVVVIDTLDPLSIEHGVAEAAEVLGGLDGIVYTSGMSPMAPMAELTQEDWQAVFGVNTFGPNLIIKAALPHLSEDSVVAAVSSDSSSMPRHSLVPYAASKRALEATMDGWRTEMLGNRRFVTVILGPTMPTEFANSFTPEAFEAAIPHWQRQGFRTGIMQGDEVAHGLVSFMAALFAAPTFGIESLLLRSPEPEVANEFSADVEQQ